MSSYICFDASILREQPASVRVHLFRRAASLLIPGQDTGYGDLQRAAAFAAHSDQERADFAGGLLLLREAGVLYVAMSEESLPSDQWPQMSKGTDAISVSAPGEVALANGWKAMLWRCDALEMDSMQPWEELTPFSAFLDARDLPGTLEVRVRRAGDRFTPLGMGGHSQKLSDFLINVKLPARARGRWPVVCAGQQVVWVPGYRPADNYRLRPDSTSVLRLAVIPPEKR
jgi:tRNA(Ile)-lysidine synthase